jgi:hypothetical protein
VNIHAVLEHVKKLAASGFASRIKRMEGGEPVRGWLVTALKPATGAAAT